VREPSDPLLIIHDLTNIPATMNMPLSNEWHIYCETKWMIAHEQPWYYRAFFFRSAQRCFIISEMRLREAALMWRRLRLGVAAA
jgi:hypothetical protein